MIGYDLDRGGPKDSETAPDSFLTKINGKGFWRFGTDMSARKKTDRYINESLSAVIFFSLSIFDQKQSTK